jgi:hypothetical protein
MAETADFLVSHTDADRAWVESIAWQVEQAGHHVIIQAWGLLRRPQLRLLAAVIPRALYENALALDRIRLSRVPAGRTGATLHSGITHCKDAYSRYRRNSCNAYVHHDPLVAVASPVASY